MPSFTERDYRNAMALYAAGVSVVAADDGARAHALTVSSFTSVSLAPPLLLVCIGETSEFLPIARVAGRFALHILREEHAALGMLFATATHEERAAALARGVGEPPRLADAQGALVRFDCALEAEHRAGDHAIVIGRPTALEADADGRPLVWWRGSLVSPPPTPL